MKQKEPACVAATLRWCNEMRAKKGKKPLKRLPKGERRNGYSCPCGKATGVFVGSGQWGHNAEESGDYFCGYIKTPKSHLLPAGVRRFVEAFDSGELPQYIAEEK
jgi:hypothetical protein